MSPSPFLYPVFGRFTYTQSAFNGQCPSISDRMFVNSRPPDREMARDLFLMRIKKGQKGLAERKG